MRTPCSDNRMAPGAFWSRDPRALLAPAREHDSSALIAIDVNAPRELHADSAKDSVLTSKLLQLVDRAFPGGFVLNKQNTMAEYLEEGMQQMMMIDKDDEVLSVMLQDGDLDLEQLVFADATTPPAFEDNEPILQAQEPKVVFSLKLVEMLFNVLSTVLKSREAKAALQTYSRSRD